MVLHFYQPPTQETEITKQILDSCYLPILRLLSQHSGYGLTLNLSGSLLLQLRQLEAGEFFDLVKKLLADGRIELLNSAVYHPLIPLTPPDVVTGQIAKNQQLLADLFGTKTTDGFFPPELAVNTAALELINSSYVIVDQTAVDAKSPVVKFGQKYLLVNNRPVCELFRSYPRELAVSTVVDLVSENCSDGGLLITANDAELFGHHYVERIRVLKDLLDLKDIKFITASQAVAQFGTKAPAVSAVKPSTWQDCQNFSLWDKNDLQKEYLALLKLAHGCSAGSDFLDQAYSSCYPYWLSNWPWWHPGLVQKGVENIKKSVGENKTVAAAAQQFLDKMWQYHHSGQVEVKYREYDQQLFNNKW
jgi:alpha-amylase/alpha-mannosidase (GH57 family)